MAERSFGRSIDHLMDPMVVERPITDLQLLHLMIVVVVVVVILLIVVIIVVIVVIIVIIVIIYPKCWKDETGHKHPLLTNEARSLRVLLRWKIVPN